MNSPDSANPTPAIVPGSTPPGPRGHWLLGNVSAFQADRLGFMRDTARDFGGVVAMRLGFRRVWLVTEPAVIESVLITHARQFRKHFALRINPIVLGNGLLTSEGDFWLRQRRLSQPALQKSQIAHYVPTFVEHTARMLARWKPGEVRDVLPEMMTLTLGIVSKTLFGGEADADADRVHAALRVTREEFVRRLARPVQIPIWIPTARNRRMRRAAKELDAIIYGFIQQRRKSGEQRDDLLSRLLNARDAGEKTGMSDKQLRDECLTIFLAGHETTALALSWSWYLLGQNPAVASRVHAEVDAVLAGRTPTVDDVPQFKEIEQVLLETMRLYPPAFIVGREALADVEIAGYRCARGTTILMPQSVVHRDSRFFAEPDEFHPERWQGDFEKQLPKCAYFPFGGGPRTCIGNTFAMVEMTLVLAMMAQKYQFTLVPGQNVTPGVQFTLRPLPGVLMSVSDPCIVRL
ncbi:MAG: cytochrome [Planctomycetaceae bacterium]|nr:cytochrome [Planctomycetaceae bacterium]